MDHRSRQGSAQSGEESHRGDEVWPAGTTASDRTCWICGSPTGYRQCKIICDNCGFTRDCSDP